jgi:hypothetical protein
MNDPTGAASPARIDATDTYEWLPGGLALLHSVDARVGEERVEGAEIIGYDPAAGTYVSQYFGTDGPTAYRATLTEDGGALVWRMESARTRFTGTFNDAGDVIDGYWELKDDDAGWQRWMDISLTRTDRAS